MTRLASGELRPPTQHRHRPTRSTPVSGGRPVACWRRWSRPTFLPQYNSDATAVVGCHCNYLRRKLTEKGFSIRHTGRVDHSPQHPALLAGENRFWNHRIVHQTTPAK